MCHSVLPLKFSKIVVLKRRKPIIIKSKMEAKNYGLYRKKQFNVM